MPLSQANAQEKDLDSPGTRQTSASSASAQKPGSADKPEDRQTADLIRRVCAGEKHLFYELVQPHERVIYRAAFSILGNEHDAEDVAQEAMLKALVHLASFRQEAKFSTWLVQITINEARMRVRKQRKSLYESLDEGSETDDGDYIPRDFADWREIPSEALDQELLRKALQHALASLAPKYQEVFLLRDVQDVSIAETAKTLGITEASVKTRLLRARLQMRDALAPGYGGNWSGGERKWKKVRPW